MGRVRRVNDENSEEDTLTSTQRDVEDNVLRSKKLLDVATVGREVRGWCAQVSCVDFGRVALKCGRDVCPLYE